ncbi:MAG: hypothetical protein JWM98_468, partial [Thermoleophilia bacterium]|nr:hypothetical protein [Thermoleophilia bacterium]
MRVTNQGRSRESAFTIVEVLVAALVITMVFAGAMYFVVGSGKGQQRTLVRQRMAAAADDIGQRVRADKDWLKQVPACKTSTCDLSSRFPVAPPKSGDAKLTASVKVSPVDGRGDGVGAADADHIVPDFFRIQVTVSMAASEQAKWGHQSNFETVSTVDATALGRAVGSLVVQTCEVTNQVDERMSFAGCEGGGGSRRAMEKQPAPCSSLPPLTWAEWLNKRPVLPHGCNAAFDAADAKSHDLTSMHVASTGSVGFTLTRDGSDGGGSVARTSGDADSGSGSGTYVFSGLPAGSYKLTVSPGAGRELWKSHTIPSAGVASVQANQEARAMIVVRPKQGVGEYRARFSRDVYLFSMGTETGSDTYTESDGVTTVQTVTTYLYLVAKGPVKETWAGPAWSGLLGMEAKPFDRYRDATNSVSQPLTMVAWAPRKAADNGWVTLGPLPSGLHSLPAQQPAPVPPPDDTWGSFGGRSQQCLGGTPGGSCGA